MATGHGELANCQLLGEDEQFEPFAEQARLDHERVELGL